MSEVLQVLGIHEPTLLGVRVQVSIAGDVASFCGALTFVRSPPNAARKQWHLYLLLVRVMLCCRQIQDLRGKAAKSLSTFCAAVLQPPQFSGMHAHAQ